MIIFDLDGTLTDCEHRRHFVDPHKAGLKWGGVEDDYHGNWTKDGIGIKWQPDWKSFYEACDKDEPVEHVIQILRMCVFHKKEFEIWSARCESFREKTILWIKNWIQACFDDSKLKMRPIGDYTPDDYLKERWLDEAIAEGKTIDLVFDDRPKVIRMWRLRGIFVFNCCQHDGEF